MLRLSIARHPHSDALLDDDRRTWADAELWCREYHALRRYFKSFDHLTDAEQTDVIDTVHHIVSGAELYLQGFTQPMNEWTRRATQPGARASEWLRDVEPVRNAQ